MKEIEKKYLLKDSILSLIKEQALQAHKITQFYTTITATKGVRYRQMDDNYFKTVKHGTGASRKEVEIKITQKEYLNKFGNHINEPVRKNRYMFYFEGLEYSIDVFKKNLKGLYLLEIEFPTMKAFKAFELPPLLQTHVIKDVTYDESYKNKNMTLHGKPSSDNLQTIFSELESMDITALEHYFIPLLSPIDALRVILYKFSLCILFYKERVILYDADEDLHQFRVNIRKSRAFLKEFAFLFSKEQFIYFYDNLSFFATLTNQKRDLDVIKERLVELDEAHEMIHKGITQQQEKEHQEIAKMLKCETFKDFFYTYQDALTGQTLVSTSNSTATIKDTAKEVLISLHGKIIKKINALEKEFEIEKLHKVRIAFKKFRYLLEEFQHVFGEEKIAKMIGKGKKLQTLLGDFNDTVNQEKLLHNYFKVNKNKISDRKELEQSMLNKTAKTQVTLKKKAMKKLHKFKEKPLKL